MIQRIGEIIRSARARASSSLEELAQRSGVEIGLLSALEAGREGISTTQLDDVALALSLDAGELLAGREVERPLPSVFLRHEPVQDFDDRDAGAFDDALDQGRALTSLGRLLGEPPLALESGVFSQREAASHQSDAPAQDGYAAAREVRCWLGDPAAPLGDVRRLIEERFGIAVVVRALASSRVTAAGIRAGVQGVIVLGEGDALRARNPLLARVYLAHELCHVLFDPSPGGLHIVIDAVVDRKSAAAEQRARAFAAELLLPLAGLTTLLGSTRDVADPATARDLVTRARSHFGTPHELAANHLVNQRFIRLQIREWLGAATTSFEGSEPATTLPVSINSLPPDKSPIKPPAS